MGKKRGSPFNVPVSPTRPTEMNCTARCLLLPTSGTVEFDERFKYPTTDDELGSRNWLVFSVSFLGVSMSDQSYLNFVFCFLLMFFSIQSSLARMEGPRKKEKKKTEEEL